MLLISYHPDVQGPETADYLSHLAADEFLFGLESVGGHGARSLDGILVGPL